jgi:hypothetical protein
MKNKLIKELRLSVGSDPSSNIMSKIPNFTTMGGFHSNADSVIAQRMTMVSEDDEDSFSEEGIMSEDIFEYRVYRNNQYQLSETLERIDEGIFQTIADIAKAVPGLDQIVGDIELYLQAGNVKEAFDGLSKVIGSLKHSAGMSGLGLIGTQQQFNELLNVFMTASEEDKTLLQEGVEELLEILKQMTITAIQTFDSVVALPSFAGTPVAGAIGEAIANIGTTLGTFLRDQPVEQFVFKTLTARTGIIAKIVEIFEKILGTANSANPVAKSIHYIVEKISKTGGDIMKIFLLQPFELFKRLGDLYKASLGQDVEIEDAEPVEPEPIATPDPVQNNQPFTSNSMVTSSDQQIQIAENYRPHSILFLLEGFDESKKAKPDFLDLDKDGDKKEPMKKAAKDAKKKNEMHHDEESFEEIDLSEFSGAGAVAGYSLPLGASNKPPNKRKDHHKLMEKQKAINEQIERMRILEAYHQKTSNRLK